MNMRNTGMKWIMVALLAIGLAGCKDPTNLNCDTLHSLVSAPAYDLNGDRWHEVVMIVDPEIGFDIAAIKVVIPNGLPGVVGDALVNTDPFLAIGGGGVPDWAWFAFVAGGVIITPDEDGLLSVNFWVRDAESWTVNVTLKNKLHQESTFGCTLNNPFYGDDDGGPDPDPDPDPTPTRDCDGNLLPGSDYWPSVLGEPLLGDWRQNSFGEWETTFGLDIVGRSGARWDTAIQIDTLKVKVVLESGECQTLDVYAQSDFRRRFSLAPGTRGTASLHAVTYTGDIWEYGTTAFTVPTH